MPKRSKPAKSRTPLSRERILKAALVLIDKEGVEGLSMRTVAAKLGVEAMSLYRHVTDKSDLLLGVADLVLSEVDVPPPGTPWREAMRSRALSAREAFIRHPSSALVVESCATMTPSRLRYCDAITGLLMADGFDPTLAYQAFLLLDSYVYGFTMQELSWPHPKPPDLVPNQVEVPPAMFPNFARVMTAVMAKVGQVGLVQSYADEFRFGLELVLDSLERQRGERRTDRASRDVSAPPATIFDAFANATKLIEWLPPNTMKGRALEYDFRVGGQYRIELRYTEGERGKTTEHADVSSGRFIAIEPNQRIVQTVVFDSKDPAFAGEMRMTWTFEPSKKGTKVTVTAENVPRGITEADHAEGLRASLENLARFVK
jgi:uncharacterized protein YndB with AHSA1/START domain